jgi:biopolymer transport protein ExbD
VSAAQGAIVSPALARGLRRAALVLALPLAGCYMPPPAPHAVVHVSAQGAYTLDGNPVAPAALEAAVAAKAASAPKLVVEIHASPAADAALVKAAVQAIERAHARVAFGRDDASA